MQKIMQKPRIAINGLGRIGRLALKLLIENDAIDVVALNDIAPNQTLVHLLKYDTAHYSWRKDIYADEDYIYIGNKKIQTLSIQNSENLPWKALNIDIVIDCSGQCKTQQEAQKQLNAGAKKIIISAPADAQTKTIVIGINDNTLKKEDIIISNASCTTNCMAPMVKIIDDNFV